MSDDLKVDGGGYVQRPENGAPWAGVTDTIQTQVSAGVGEEGFSIERGDWRSMFEQYLSSVGEDLELPKSAGDFSDIDELKEFFDSEEMTSMSLYLQQFSERFIGHEEQFRERNVNLGIDMSLDQIDISEEQGELGKKIADTQFITTAVSQSFNAVGQVAINANGTKNMSTDANANMMNQTKINAQSQALGSVTSIGGSLSGVLTAGDEAKKGVLDSEKSADESFGSTASGNASAASSTISKTLSDIWSAAEAEEQAKRQSSYS